MVMVKALAAAVKGLAVAPLAPVTDESVAVTTTEQVQVDDGVPVIRPEAEMERFVGRPVAEKLE